MRSQNDQYWRVEVYLPGLGEWMPSPPLRSPEEIQARIDRWGKNQIRILKITQTIEEVQIC